MRTRRRKSGGPSPIGRSGDFYTSVSAGPLFGWLLARQFFQMWQRLGEPEKFWIVEQGAQYAAQNPVPVWLEMNFETLTGRVLSLPRRKDINLPINEQLIVELYSK